MIENKKSKASFFNMVAAVVYQIIAAIGGFIIPGLILSTYGAVIHGYTSTISNAIVYVSLVTAGLAPAAIQAYYKPLMHHDNNLLSSVYSTIKECYNKAGILYFICLLVTGCILQYILCKQLSFFYIYALLLSMGLTGVMECFLYSRCRVLLLADQSLYYVTFVDSAVYLLRIVIQVIMIMNSVSIVLVMAVPAFLTPLRAGFLNSIIKKRYLINNEIKSNKSLLDKRHNAFIHQITSLIVLNTDVVLLTIVGNLIQVSIYSVYNLVFASFYGLLTNMFKNGTVASFGNLLFDKQDRLRSVYNKFEFVYYMIVAVIYSCCGVLILPFIRLYTSGQSIKYDDVTVAGLFLIIGIANNIRVPADTLITAAGHFKETQWRAIFEALINLFISILLVKPLGMTGILLGTLISFLYRSTDIVLYTYSKILNQKVMFCAFRILRMVFIIGINLLICNGITKHINIENWMEWFLAAMLVGAISLIVSFLINYFFEPLIFRELIQNYIKKK